MIDSDLIIQKPKISIIITYYNLGKYIQDCINSILSQTYQNFEIIIVNDFSDEKNSEILNKFKNEKIQIINLNSNQGQLCAFLEGLKVAQGEFICMIDADDVVLPNYLEVLLYSHLNNKIALISSSCGEINDKNEVTLFQKNQNKKIKYGDINQLFDKENEFEIKKNKLPFGLWGWNPSTSAMFRKSAVEILFYYPNKEYWKTGADKVIFSLLHLIGGSINIDAILYLYRHHKDNNSQTTLTTGNKKYLNENYIKKIINWNIKLRLDTIKMFLKYKKEFIFKFNKINYYKMLLRCIFCINLKVLFKIFKTIIHKVL